MSGRSKIQHHLFAVLASVLLSTIAVGAAIAPASVGNAGAAARYV